MANSSYLESEISDVNSGMMTYRAPPLNPLRNRDKRTKIDFLASIMNIHDSICGMAIAINDFFLPILSVTYETWK